MPYFQISESIIENKIKIIIKEYKTTNSLMLKQLILEDINENWSECEHIFTDGSIINNRTGCAFYHKNLNYKKKIRLINNTSIFTAELWAIFQALQYCLELDSNQEIVIFTDSKSSLQALKNWFQTEVWQENLLTVVRNVLNTYCELKNQQKEISFVRVKAHVNISGKKLVLFHKKHC